MNGFTSNAIHGAYPAQNAHGSLRVPVYDSVAFAQETSEDLHQAFAGRRPAHIYSRITNPTVTDFEQKLQLISNGAGVVAVSSGMAAISTLILSLAGAGTNIITTRHLFGNTLSLFERTLGPWGLEVRLADMTSPDTLAQLIDENTRAVFLESITNPQLEVADIKAIARVAEACGVPVILDNTVTTPYLFPAKDFGVAVEVLSTTKYISGGAPCLGGAIIDLGTFDWRKSPRLAPWAARMGPHALIGFLRREVFRNVGACMAPHHAYLHSLGLESMGLRIEKSCDNALKLARFLKKHEAVVSVSYPGLSDSPFHPIASRQFSQRFGGILTFELVSRGQCFAVMDAFRLIRRATNVNDNKTLVLHPASTIFEEYAEEDRRRMGVGEAMLRLSVGIEDYEDIEDDLVQSLARS